MAPKKTTTADPSIEVVRAQIALLAQNPVIYSLIAQLRGEEVELPPGVRRSFRSQAWLRPRGDGKGATNDATATLEDEVALPRAS